MDIRSGTVLEPLLSQHEYWPMMQKIISAGVTYNLEEVLEENRDKDFIYAINRGNYKSVSDLDNEYTLIKNHEKEVCHGDYFSKGKIIYVTSVALGFYSTNKPYLYVPT